MKNPPKSGGGYCGDGKFFFKKTKRDDSLLAFATKRVKVQDYEVPGFLGSSLVGILQPKTKATLSKVLGHGLSSKSLSNIFTIAPESPVLLATSHWERPRFILRLVRKVPRVTFLGLVTLYIFLGSFRVLNSRTLTPKGFASLGIILP